jgi:fatty-acid desaturase
MMKGVLRVNGRDANPLEGRVVWSPVKSIWNMGMLLTALIFGALTISVSAILMFICSTYITLLLGHSLGMHRRFIHKSYQCKKWFERLLIYIGVIVGVAGPFGILRVHDLRDWAQRQSACHDFFAHRRSFLVDLFWQLNCKFEFKAPPQFKADDEFANDRWYQFLERTWMLHQIPVALVLYFVGGWAWVVWGVCARVAASAIGHWTVTYFCHNPGAGKWRVKGASVHAANLSGLGIITYGECWHNNHHAFPESARIGLEQGQSDPGWVLLKLFEKIGWVSQLGLPRGELEREDLITV